MAQPPADNNPFGEIEADTLDRVPRPTTAKQAIWVILLIGVGAYLFLARERVSQPAAAFATG